MNFAEKLLTNKEDKAWNYNHLAYAYEQKFAASNLAVDKNKSLYYTHQVISTLYSDKPNKEVAFAYCVKGLVLNDAKDYGQAEKSFKTALAMYEAMPDGKDDQYARAKNRLANIILDQNGRDNEALVMLQQLKTYWKTKSGTVRNPYAARNLISLGQAYLKIGNAYAARDEFDSAIRIYTNIYGNNSSLLAKPYQLLSDAYKKLGDAEQASFYERKVRKLL
jgi:tetratricopeptide (TPR) repeat protein